MKVTEELLEELRNRWIKIGHATDPIDVDACIPLINEIYANSKLPPPELIFTAPSPLEAVKMNGALLKLGYKKVRKSNDPQALVEKVAKTIDIKKCDHDKSFLGNQDAPILSFYEVFVNSGEVTGIEDIIPFIKLAEVSGWWLPLRKAIILVERPNSIKFDENGVTHCEDGPAISYDDSDFGVYMWHGIRVPPSWIKDKSSLTPEIALNCPNTEQRRAGCEILGWENVLNTLNPTVIDKNPDEEIGELLEVELPDIGVERFLKVRCGTGRIFMLPVPPDVSTALEANAWTYGVSSNDYAPEVRT